MESAAIEIEFSSDTSILSYHSGLFVLSCLPGSLGGVCQYGVTESHLPNNEAVHALRSLHANLATPGAKEGMLLGKVLAIT